MPKLPVEWNSRMITQVVQQPLVISADPPPASDSARPVQLSCKSLTWFAIYSFACEAVMAGQRARRRLACAFIFLLAMGLRRAREMKIVGNARDESSARHQQQELVTDAGSFSISTM